MVGDYEYETCNVAFFILITPIMDAMAIDAVPQNPYADLYDETEMLEIVSLLICKQVE